jgi:hypothetical protein
MTFRGFAHCSRAIFFVGKIGFEMKLGPAFPEHRIFVGCHQTWFGQFPAISASVSGFPSHV